MDKRTPLYSAQKALGAKFTSFGGWELPVLYTDILKEHNAVRNNAGLFDVSHMGEILISGEDAVPFVNKIITNDVSAIPQNKILYSPMCYENGTVVDDILIYKFSEDEILLIVNAGNIEKDEAWIHEHVSGNVTVENISDKFVLLALQGPKSEEILKTIMDEEIELPSFYWFTETNILGMKVLLSRTGYTGEDGFEIYLYLPNPCADYEKLWNGILDAGKDMGIMPTGLGARDTLRLEAALPLYGHELSDSILPLEARLKTFVKLDKKEDFIGRTALSTQLEQGLKRKLYGFEMIDRAIPRNGYEVTRDGAKIGYVTSGGLLPTMGKNGGLVLSEDLTLANDDTIEIIIRQRACEAKIVPLPFYKKKYKK